MVLYDLHYDKRRFYHLRKNRKNCCFMCFYFHFDSFYSCWCHYEVPMHWRFVHPLSCFVTKARQLSLFDF